MTRTRRLYRVTITHANGDTAVWHYQTRRAAEYRRAGALDGYTRGPLREDGGGPPIPPARSAVFEVSDPITWPTPGGAS